MRVSSDSCQWYSVTVERTPEYGKFYLNMRETFFTVGVTEHWNRLLREVLESSPWRYWKHSWSRATCCRWSTLSGVLTRWFPEPSSNPNQSVTQYVSVWFFPSSPCLWFSRLSREVVVDPSLEVFKARLDGTGNNLICWSRPMAAGLEVDELWRSIPI